MVEYNLKNKYALVSGGTHGIGLAICKTLAKHGVNIATFSRSDKNIQNAKNELKEFDVKLKFIQADALDNSAADIVISNLFDDEFPRVDILINNVGGGGRWGKESIIDTDDIVWMEVFQKNALIAAYLTKRCLPSMVTNKWGRVITITSIYGKESGGRPWFTMAKSAEVAIMKSLSLDKGLVRNGITFNTIAPGGIFIPGAGFEDEMKKDPEGFKSMIDSEYPLGRMGTPQEVANLVAFICSDLSALINGAQIVIDGGQTRSF